MSDTKWYLRHAKLEDALNHGLTEAEFSSIIELVGRELNMVELGVFSALYSEHCSYKSTKIHLKTLPTQGPRVILGPGENAGVVDIGDGQGVAFKVESHNHPSFIEPFQGAATGVGGILRDVFTMGARPLALMNALRFGEPSNSKTKHLISGAVKGIGTYGNCMGVPTVGGELMFHESYNGNCLVNAFALGLVDQDKIFLGRASGIGNSLIYVGSKTGRDGIHGASMASQEFDDNSEEKRPTVQVGDPFQEKLLLEACLEAMQCDGLVGIQDMGAAGMTSSSYEMASRAGTGLRINLDQIPMREQGMNPYELMLSESQERMLLIAERGKEGKILEIFKRWGLDAVSIGQVIDGQNVELYWFNEMISSLPVDLLVNKVPQYRWPEEAPSDYRSKIEFDIKSIDPHPDLSKVWLELIGSPNVCSRFPLFSQYDSTVRTNTVVHPGGDSGVIRIKAKSNPNSKKNPAKQLYNQIEKGIAMTLDCNSRYCSIDPRQGAALTIAEAVRNVSSVGAEPIGISDCLNFGSPEKPDGMWQIAESIRGLGEAARAFEVPIISGNVSLYNETKGKAVIPTPMVAMVGLMSDASKAVGANFRSAGDRILVIGESLNELGGSEYMAFMAGVEKGALPKLDYDLEIASAKFIRYVIQKGLISSCHDLSSGGLAVALAECCLGVYSSLGATIELENAVDHRYGRNDALLFGESGARYIISLNPNNEEQVRRLAAEQGIKITLSGSVGGSVIEISGFAALDLTSAEQGWKNGLNVFF